MNDTLKQYLREVKKRLPCSPSEKKRCIMELEADVTAFLEHHPDASLTEIYDSIGSPESIAKSFMDRVSPNELSHKLSAKRKIVAAILAIAIVLSAIVAVLVAVTTYKLQLFMMDTTLRPLIVFRKMLTPPLPHCPPILAIHNNP